MGQFTIVNKESNPGDSFGRFGLDYPEKHYAFTEQTILLPLAE